MSPPLFCSETHVGFYGYGDCHVDRCLWGPLTPSRRSTVGICPGFLQYLYGWGPIRSTPTTVLSLPFTTCVGQCLPDTSSAQYTRGLRFLPGVRFFQPLFEMLRAEVGASAWLKGEQATNPFLHYCLQCGCIIPLSQVHMCFQGYAWGVWFLPLI